MHSPAVAQTWTGGGGSGAWSDAANWTPGAPTSAANTALVFDADGNGFDPTNNTAGFTLNLIQMNDGFTQTVTGQSLILRGINPRIFMHSNSDVTITNDIAFIDDSGGFQGVYFDGSGAGNFTLSGVLSSLDPNITDPNLGRLAVQNGLTITLSGANTYYGRTDVTGASLIAANDFALGAATAGTFVNPNSTLALQGNIDLQEQGITLNGTGVGGNGALRNLSGNNTVVGAITLGGATRIQSDADTLTLTGIGGANQNLTLGGAGDIAVDSAIATGTGSVTLDGSGTVTFLGANTYTGGTTVRFGSLIVDDGTISHAGADLVVADLAGDDGTLTVANGGVVTNNAGLIGNQVGSEGEVTVTGAGSTWTNSGLLNVGFDGTGTLTIVDGGSVSNTGAYIGTLADRTGEVTVTGAGSIWTSSSDVRVGSSGTGTLTIADGGSVSNNNGAIGDNGTGTGEVTVTGADSTWTNSGSLFVGSSGSGMLTIQDGGSVSNTDGRIGSNSGSPGGAVTVTGAGSTWTNSGELRVGTFGDGTLTIAAGGTVSNAVGRIGLGSDSTSEATVTGAGSVWTNSGELSVGHSGDGTLNVEDGGSVSNTDGRIGFNTGSTGEVTVMGAGSTWTNSGLLNVGESGDGTLTIADGGMVSATGDLTLAALAGSTGTLNIGAGGAAGILNATSVAGGDGTATLNFNHTDTDYSFTDDGTAGGTALTITGSAAVNHTGTGTTTLTGNNSYTGATNVNAGTLQVNGDQSAATGPVTVADGATLGGNGTLGGDVTVADGGTLAPGTSPGTLTMGALALNAGSILDFELGEANAAGGPLNDLINVNGDLTLDGTLNVTQSEGGLYGAGTYRLIDYSGTLTDNGLELGLMPAGSTNVVQTSIASQVNLINTQGLLLNYWDGPTAPGNGQIEGGDGVWQASAGNQHWATADGLINAPYQDAAMAIFSGASGIVTVDDSLGAVRVTGMQFAADGYRLEGDAVTLMPGTNTMRIGDGTQAGAAYTATIASVLTGDGGLGKSDLGTLVLTGENTYAGGTTISAGALQVGDGGTTGSIVGDIANAGTLSFYRSDNLVFDGLISGSGAVEQIGSGTTTLTGTNTYTGITSIFDGVLALSGAGSIESSSNIRADGIFDISATDAGASVRTLSGNGTAVLGSQALTLTAASGTFGGAVTGPGSLIMDGTGSWTLTGTGSEVGALDVRAGALEVANGASFAAQATNIAADATLTNEGSFSGTADADSFALGGSLIGHVDLQDGDDLVEIADGADFSQASFAGGDGIDTMDLTHGGALTLPAALAVNFEHLIKRGTGELTLEGAVDGFSDSIELAQGTALLSNATITTGEVRVASGASLMGTGSLSGGLVNAGLLSPGTSPGTLDIGGNFAQDASGTLLSEITPSGTDLLDIGGSATLAGTHQIQIQYGLYLDGTTHTLIEVDGGITGDFDNVEINPSALMTAERELSATAETVNFARLPTTTITDPGTNKGNYAEWLDDLIAAGGLTPDMIDYVDLLLQQPTADAAGGLLGETADPVAGVSQNSVSMLGEGFAGTVFERFAAVDLTRCIDGDTRDERNCAWIQGLRKWGDADGDRFGPGYDWTTDGMQSGYDRKLASDWILGVTLGFVRTDTEDLRGGRNDLRSRMAGLYASYASERFGFSAIAQYADNENRTARDVVIGTTARRAGATFDSDSYGLGARVDYRLTPADRPLVRPFAELLYDRIDGDEFVEAGAETGNLSGRLHDRHGLRLTAGLQLANNYVGYDRVFRPSLELGVVRQLRDTQSVIDLQPFDGASSFRAYGVELDRTAYVAQASLGMTLGEHTSVSIGYGGERASNYSEQEVNLGFRIVW